MPARGAAARAAREAGGNSPPPSPFPLSAEFIQITVTTGVGFLAMGVISFVVKIVHIPITQILLG